MEKSEPRVATDLYGTKMFNGSERLPLFQELEQAAQPLK